MAVRWTNGRQCIIITWRRRVRAASQAEKVILRVQCYAGWTADERPVRFQLGDREYLIEEVLDQWYGPDDAFFKVRADDGNVYILRHESANGEWSLESFRRL